MGLVATGAVSSAGATTPGVNGRIAFSSERDARGHPEIYSVGFDGTGERRLTWTTLSINQLPSWSPDGTRIAFERFTERSADEGSRIWVMNADGSDQTQLTPTDRSGVDREPAWSPDGTQIAFASTRAGTYNLWVINVDGSGMRRVTDAFTTSPAWSPDGQNLAYVGSNGIGVVNVSGTNPHTVSAPGAFASGTSWSPGGRQIVFARSDASGYPGELYVVNSDGSGEHQLTTDGFHNAHPAWSPDGTRITFQRTNNPLVFDQWGLWSIAADGSDLRQIPTAGSAIGPDWGSSQVVPEPSPPLAPIIDIYAPVEGSKYLPGMDAQALYLCSSFVSYITSCVGDVPFGEQLDLTPGLRTFTVRATDGNGETTTRSVTYRVLDFDPPQIELRTPPDGATYEPNANVAADYSCTDAGGIASCVGDLPKGASLDTSRPGTFTFTVWARDNVGNVNSVQAKYTVLDHQPPLIQLNAPSDHASYDLGSFIAIRYSCTDPGGIRSCQGDLDNGARLDTHQAGTFAFTVVATDNTGNTSRATATYTIVDRRPPVVTIESPTDGSYFVQGAGVLAHYSCSSPSGARIVLCFGTVADGAPVDESVGAHSFNVTGYDENGRATTLTNRYNVFYAFTGFGSPVDTTGSLDGVKAGEPIPLKFSLNGDQGPNVVGKTTWQMVSCADGSPVATKTTGEGKLSYNASSDRYSYLVATSGSWKGTCATLDVVLADGTTHPISVRFKG